MTNEMMEHLTGSLWMITKPGGYAHLNQLGRVYRDKQQALKHKDFDEVVVELRLANAVEPTCDHDWVSLIGGIRCVKCGEQIAARALSPEKSPGHVHDWQPKDGLLRCSICPEER